jgi:ribosomal protein L44E
MPNRQLTSVELDTLFRPLMLEVRAKLQALSSGDSELHWALRRKLTKELGYDERSRPGDRRALKAYKRGEQKGVCALCPEALPEKYAVLDRLEAMLGYTKENTRLICQAYDIKVQESRGYK